MQRQSSFRSGHGRNRLPNQRSKRSQSLTRNAHSPAFQLKNPIRHVSISPNRRQQYKQQEIRAKSLIQPTNNNYKLTRNAHSPAFQLKNPIRHVSISPHRRQQYKQQQIRAKSLTRPTTDNDNLLRVPHAKWVGKRFVRNQQFFKGLNSKFWMHHPYFITWYNSFYPTPFTLLKLFRPIVIEADIDTRNQQALENFIKESEIHERINGTAPQDPTARLFPDFTHNPPVLHWALPI